MSLDYKLTHVCDDMYEAYANIYPKTGVGGCIGHLYPTEQQALDAAITDGQTVVAMLYVTIPKPTETK